MNAACYCFLLLAQKIANMRIFRSERPNTYAIQTALAFKFAASIIMNNLCPGILRDGDPHITFSLWQSCLFIC